MHFGSRDVTKVPGVVAGCTFPSQNVKNNSFSDHFWTYRCRFAWQAQEIVHIAKSKQNVMVLKQFQKRFCEIFEEDLQRCMLCSKSGTKDTWVNMGQAF